MSSDLPDAVGMSAAPGRPARAQRGTRLASWRCLSISIAAIRLAGLVRTLIGRECRMGDLIIQILESSRHSWEMCKALLRWTLRFAWLWFTVSPRD